MKDVLCSIIGLVGSTVSAVFGGCGAGLTTLCICMGIDILSGVLVAGVFKKSKKTQTGALKSAVGYVGLMKKGMIFLLVLVAHRIDLTIGTNYVRDAVIIAFIANEVISIIENAGLMGITIPTVLKNAIDVLTEKGDDKNGK